MTIVRRLARPLLAAPLIQSGVQTFRHPGPQAESVQPLLAKVGPALKLPDDPELIVRAGGAVTAAAGALLALGRLPRLSALAIVLVSPTVAGDALFWQEKDPEARRAQQTLFLKNLGLVGGALLAAVDTEGKPGVTYRARRAAKVTAKESRRAAKDAKRATREARKTAKLKARDIAGRASLPFG